MSQNQRINKEALAGATACIKALQSAVQIERRGFDNPETNDYSVGRYFRDCDEIKEAFIKSAGVSSAFQSGFIATLAEYVHYVMSTGEPDVFHWKPETLMTGSEVKESREEAIRFSAEDEGGTGAASNLEAATT
jgi:hypothetical protein